MSRNLCETECYRCGTKPTLDEKPRPILEEEAGVYFAEFEGMLVANATCQECGALYLAWVDQRTRKRFDSWMPGTQTAGDFVDLSFRSSFNDEPGDGDLPPWERPTSEALATSHRMSARWKALAKRYREQVFSATWTAALRVERDAARTELAALREAVERAKCPDSRIGRRSSPCAECEEAWMSLTKGGE